jgi:stearoyl-CoA desaturase (delta-9 desaturase)
MAERKLDWTNTLVLVGVHLLAAVAVAYLALVHFSWWTLGLGVLWLGLCGLSITGGYHRLFAHPTYSASPALRLFYLLFGAGSVQNSALKWSSDHRIHHSRTDTDEDPYNITRGFFWAHMGWVFFKDPQNVRPPAMRDLRSDPLILWQDRHYVALAILIGLVLPASLGLLWGDPLGALLVAGFLRLCVQWHATFAVNSFAHTIGWRPYCTTGTARDSFITALITLGEGYHNFHHRFQQDYRNGIRWYHLDPTKWFIWTMSKLGVTADLKRTAPDVIRAARQEVARQPIESSRA